MVLIKCDSPMVMCSPIMNDGGSATLSENIASKSIARSSHSMVRPSPKDLCADVVSGAIHDGNSHESLPKILRPAYCCLSDAPRVPYWADMRTSIVLPMSVML